VSGHLLFRTNVKPELAFMEESIRRHGCPQYEGRKNRLTNVQPIRRAWSNCAPLTHLYASSNKRGVNRASRDVIRMSEFRPDCLRRAGTNPVEPPHPLQSWRTDLLELKNDGEAQWIPDNPTFAVRRKGREYGKIGAVKT
jgi:hypothetical protein